MWDLRLFRGRSARRVPGKGILFGLVGLCALEGWVLTSLSHCPRRGDSWGMRLEVASRCP